MIKGMHGMFYSTDAAATREFLRDVLGLKGTDVGDGWLIFDVKQAELGVHPGDSAGFHVSFYCDDIAATVKELEARGVTFTEPVVDQGFGLVTHFEAPGGLKIELFQPAYTVSRD